MKPRILLVNPPVHDFSAYDFWLKPFGLLTVAGYLRSRAELTLFDALDRSSELLPPGLRLKEDRWGRGQFYSEEVPKPALFAEAPRRYHRFGVPRAEFQRFLRDRGPFDFALVQTGMTYWYPGVREVLADLRDFCPRTRAALGGVYATLMPEHARALGAELVVEGSALAPLWAWLGLAPDTGEVPFWEGYARLQTGVLKLTDGCPFKCTYCSVSRLYSGFSARPLERVLAEFDALSARGVRHIAFYDDALLFDSPHVLEPFLKGVLARGAGASLHTPNAINARFVTPELARLMCAAGFKVIYLGFESKSGDWQSQTGGKVLAGELARAVDCLRSAGVEPGRLHAYLIAGHPRAEGQDLTAAMEFAHSLGIRVMLAEFSPLPGTPDGELCRRFVDLDEPLNHNKTFFAQKILGTAEVNRLKRLSHELNRRL